MKSKTLMTLAVASALGLSASAFAGAGYEVQTPMSVNESGPVLAQHHHGMTAVGSTSSSSAMGEVSGSDTFTANVGGLELSDATDWSTSYDMMAEADQGMNDVYVVGWTPVEIDYYIVDVQPSDELALDEFGYSDEGLALGDESFGLTQEDRVASVLSQYPVDDGAEVG
jgi:hypothetical protein